MKRIFEPEAYAASSTDGCYWGTTVVSPHRHPQVSGDVAVDFVVIGGGYTGLSAALHLAEADAEVLVLEAQTIGWGASGRNGGFACMGGAGAGDAALKKRFGLEGVKAFFKAQRASVDLVDAVLATHAIDADRHSDGESIMAHRPRDAAGLRHEADLLATLHGVKAEFIAKEELPDRGMAGPFHGALNIPVGFALNPLKYLFGLAAAATRSGASIRENTLALNIRRTGQGFRVSTPNGVVTARHLILATNGYSSDDLPGWIAGRYMPAQSNIIVTRTLSQSEIADQGWSSGQMAYDTRGLLHYFRLMPDGRFLFGMRGGLSAKPAVQARMKSLIRKEFETMFPAWAHVGTPFFWSGLLCLSRSLTPYVGPLGDWPDAHVAIAYHGNGVAMGTYSGALLADLALGRAPRHEFPAVMQAPLRRFPLGRARRVLLRPAYFWYGLKDRG